MKLYTIHAQHVKKLKNGLRKTTRKSLLLFPKKKMGSGKKRLMENGNLFQV